MKIPIEQIPPNLVKEVVFDDSLMDVFIRNYGPGHDAVDTFWSMIYHSRISPDQRNEMSAIDAELSSLRIIPFDYDYEAGEIEVLLYAYWRNLTTDEIFPGESFRVTVDIEGNLVDERCIEPLSYSVAMKPHIRELLAQTALNCQPLPK